MCAMCAMCAGFFQLTDIGVVVLFLLLTINFYLKKLAHTGTHSKHGGCSWHATWHALGTHPSFLAHNLK